MMKKKNIGISLLELLLSLAIIAILLVMATRYYQVTRSGQQINEAISILENVMTGADSWYWSYKSFNTISMQALADAALVPPDLAKPNSNPWGGAVTITPRDSNHVTIQMTDISTADCTNLREIMGKKGIPGICLLNQDTFSFIYPVSPPTSNGNS